MKFIKIIIIIIFIFFASGCNKIIIDKLPNNYYINLKNANIEVYNELYLDDLIETNVSIPKDIKIDTTSLGEKTYAWNFKINNKKYLYHINYNIVDTTKPKIFGSTTKNIYIGSTQNICDSVMYGDNYDKNPSCLIEGTYDLKKIGKYKVKLIIKDSSSNETNYNMTLNVIEKKSETSSRVPSKTLFNDIVKNHKNKSTKIGIDVSRWQGDIDYKKVKNAGAEFVMMRIGVQVEAGKNPEMDSKFIKNIKSAKEAGLLVGVYFYSIALTEKEAESQALWVIDVLNNETLDLPIVFDWESWTKWNSYNLSFYDINSIANAFMNTIENHGYKAMLYGSKFYLENIWENKKNYPVWLAHYTKNTTYEKDYLMWQLCDNGKIEGIQGNVDINVLYGG